MSRITRSAVLTVVTAVVTGTALAVPADAAGTWSAPVQLSTPIAPTYVVDGATVAANHSGALVAAWEDQASDGTQFVHVRTSADGTTWSAPTTLGEGVTPSVALAPDGRAVAMWTGLPPIAGTVQASVRAPGGSWSAPVTVSPDAGPVQVAMDASGNTVAVWASSAGIESTRLPAGGVWTPIQTLDTGGKATRLAVNASGSAVATWAESNGAIMAASGTALIGFSTPVTIAPAAYQQTGPSVALSDSGQASLVWRGRTTALAATRSADGTWTQPVQLEASATGSVATAIDGQGNVIAVYSGTAGSGGTNASLYLVRRNAGDSGWGTPTMLSATPGGYVLAGADPAGSFVVVWTDSTIEVRTADPGAPFGPTVSMGNTLSNFALATAPGHAALMWTGGGATVSTESVS